MIVEKSAFFFKSDQFPLQGQNYDLIQESVSLDEVATLQGGVAIIFCFVEAGLVKSPCPPMFFWSRIIVIFNFTKHLSLGKRSSKVRKCKAAKMN